MAATSVITVRIDPELHEALKAKVRREGTTLSAAIVRLLRAEVRPGRRRLARPTMGMFAGQFEDLDLGELKRMRRKFSARLLSSVRGRNG